MNVLTSTMVCVQTRSNSYSRRNDNAMISDLWAVLREPHQLLGRSDPWHRRPPQMTSHAEEELPNRRDRPAAKGDVQQPDDNREAIVSQLHHGHSW